ncbi:MAG: hypothetical protein E7056_06220 [Lentisphaerae bacterium]|nr:hypothetical protein [Lentisphaerota bacterium]
MTASGKKTVIISQNTIRRIRISVVACHFMVILLVLTFSVISDWLYAEEETITVAFYDPELDNIVENPSPDPDPDNPVPPSGEQDGAEQSPQPNEQDVPPPVLPDLTAVKQVVQPDVKPRALPLPEKVAPAKVITPQQAAAIKQPKVKSRALPKSAKTSQASKSDKNKSANTQSARAGRRGPRGSNSQSGHTAPGGQRGNSGYDIQVAMMIKRMWVTPDLQRLGGREPRVLIEVRIAPSGQVLEKRIRTRSGVLAMDESVSALLNNLYRVKPPFDGKEHTLVFWLKAEDD